MQQITNDTHLRRLTLLICFITSCFCGYAIHRYFDIPYTFRTTPPLDTLKQIIYCGQTYLRYGQYYTQNKDNLEKTSACLTQAIGYFNEILTIKPDCHESYCLLGIAYHMQGKNKKALEAFNHAITLQPQYGEAYFYKAELLIDEKQFDQAVSLYQKINNDNPDNPVISKCLAHAKQKQKEYYAQLQSVLQST